MKYQPLNDLIDPEVVPEDAVVPAVVEDDPDAPNDAYVIGEHGNTVQAPDAQGQADDEQRPRPWVKPFAIISAALCALLTVWNLTHLVSGPPAPPPPSPFQVKQTLYLGVMKLEAYRRVHGVTPETLEEADLPSPPYAYRRISPTQYAVSFENAGAKLEYDSGIPMEKFFGTPQEMLAIGGSE